MPADPLALRLLGVGLRALVRAQSARLGPHAARLREAARLGLDAAGAEAETAIEAYRAELAASGDTIAMQDFGAGTRAGLLHSEAKPALRRVAEIYERAAATPAWGRFLYRLVRELEPGRVLELGTNLGVSAAHIALALEHNQRAGGPAGRLVTLEGDPALAERARRALARLGHEARTTVVTGRFDDTLGGVLAEAGPFDLVFLDGHHEAAATLRYFERIRPHLAPGACVAFDDIEPTRPVRTAWRRILEAEPSSGHADLFGLGLWFAPLAKGADPPREETANESTAAQ